MSTVSKIDDHSFEKWKKIPEEPPVGRGGYCFFVTFVFPKNGHPF